MNERYATYILDKINDASQKYDTKGERLLYEQGVLVGLLTVLALQDSKNFDIIRKQLDKLK